MARPRKAATSRSASSGNERGAEAGLDLGVVLALDGEVAEVVVVEEAIEDVGAEHGRDRHRDLDAGKAAAQALLGQQPPHEGEAARLAAQRAAAHPVEVARQVEVVAVEVGDEGAALLQPVGGDRPDEARPQRPRALVVVEPARAQLVGEGELGPRLEPAGEVVAVGVVDDRLLRHACASCSSSPRRSAARPTSVPSGRRKTKSPKPKCSSITSRSSWRSSGDPLRRKSAPTLWARASFSGREECRMIGTSGYAARTCRAKSAPARGTFSPARGNSTSEMMPSTSSA